MATCGSRSSTGDRIGRITPAGVVTEFSAGITTGAGPQASRPAPTATCGSRKLSATGSDGLPRSASSPSSAPASRAGAGPLGITAGPDGNLWFTEIFGNRIGRITPLGVVTEFSAGITAGAEPRGITAGPDGNLWFTEYSGNRIGRITPLGVVTEFSAGITAGAAPFRITVGPDGNLWFTENSGNRIGRVGFSPLALLSAASRKVHGPAGTFDLPLSLAAANPTTEPRQSATATIVMSFDSAIISATAVVTEGPATVGTLTFTATT